MREQPEEQQQRRQVRARRRGPTRRGRARTPACRARTRWRGSRSRWPAGRRCSCTLRHGPCSSPAAVGSADAGHEAGDAGERVQRQHEAVAVEHEAEVGGASPGTTRRGRRRRSGRASRARRRPRRRASSATATASAPSGHGPDRAHGVAAPARECAPRVRPALDDRELFGLHLPDHRHMRPGRLAYGPVADLTNAQIAAAFEELADLYELDGAVQYRVIAYRNAARTVRDSAVSVAALARDGQGHRAAEHRQDARGEDAARSTRPATSRPRQAAREDPGRPDLGHAPAGLRPQAGAPAVRRARRRLARRAARGGRGRAAARAARLRGQGRGEPAPGAGRGRRRHAGRRASSSRARSPSPRRSPARCASTRRPTASRSPARCAAWPSRSRTSTSSPRPPIPRRWSAALAELPQVESVASSGEAGARVMTHTGMKVDLRVVEPDQFGNVLQHFTGSKAHNVALRESAVRRGLHVSEYGILDDATGETTALRDRGGGLRDARPGLDPARAARGPRRARGRDAGRRRAAGPDHAARTCAATCTATRRRPTAQQTAEEMVEAARERGMKYLAITDHSASHGFGDHVDDDTLRARIEEIRALNAADQGLRGADRDRVQHPHRTARSTTRTTCSSSSTGSIASIHTSFQHGREEDDRPHDRGDRAPAGRRHRPPDGPQDRAPRALRGSTSSGSSRPPRARAR